MSKVKFIQSSIWTFFSNVLIKLMGILIFPFLIRHFLKSDISIFKSFQAGLAIIFSILPFGTNYLYITSQNKESNNGTYWKIFTMTVTFLAFFSSLFLLIIIIFFKTKLNLNLSNFYYYIIIIMPFLI